MAKEIRYFLGFNLFKDIPLDDVINVVPETEDTFDKIRVVLNDGSTRAVKLTDKLLGDKETLELCITVYLYKKSNDQGASGLYYSGESTDGTKYYCKVEKVRCLGELYLYTCLPGRQLVNKLKTFCTELNSELIRTKREVELENIG